MFGGIAKWVAQIESAERVPEYLYRAFTTATSGPARAGRARAAGGHARRGGRGRRRTAVRAAAGAPGRGRARAPARAARRREAAVRDRRRRRLDGAGRGRTSSPSPRRTSSPSAPAFRRQDYVDNASPRLRRPRRHRPRPEARGARARRRPAARRRRAPRRVDDRRLHARRGRPAAPDPRPRPRRRRGARPRLPAGSSGSSPARRSSRRPRGRSSPSTRRPGAPRPSRRTPTTSRAWQHTPGPGDAADGRRDGVCCASGCRRTRSSRTAPATSPSGRTASTSSAASRRSSRRRAARWATACLPPSPPSCVHPERLVVCFAGDGDFLMSGQELATAVQYELPIVVLVVNNGMYGTIRMHQERHYPGRVFGTDLVNPDFARYAEAFGGHGEVVERTEEFAPAFERAVASGRPAVIELRVDPEAITPRATLSEIRATHALRATSDRRLERDHHRGRAAAGAARTAARQAAARQGPDRHRRDPHDLRLEDLRGSRADPKRARGGAPRGGRRRHRRQGEPARVRVGRHEPEPVVRDGAEPSASRQDDRRLVRRQRGGARGRSLRPRPGDGHRLLDPPARRLLRARRPEAELGAHPHRRRVPALPHLRHRRPDGPHRRGGRARVVGARRRARARAAAARAHGRPAHQAAVGRRPGTAGEPRGGAVRRAARAARRPRRRGRDPGARGRHVAALLPRGGGVAPRDVPGAGRRLRRERARQAGAGADARPRRGRTRTRRRPQAGASTGPRSISTSRPCSASTCRRSTATSSRCGSR